MSLNLVFNNYNSCTCSEEKCSSAPDECADIIPYTTYPNQLFELNSTEEYTNFSDAVRMSLEQCSIDPYMARWGACNMMFPRCLMGYELQFCRKSCLGKKFAHLLIFD